MANQNHTDRNGDATSPTPQIFAFDDQMVRTVDQTGEVWFVAKDVCKALDIANDRHAISRLDSDEKGVVNNDTLGGHQELNIINESGLYSLILTSRKEEAKRFKRWVTHEVLPTIRKTGFYEMEQKAAPLPNLISLQQQSLKLIAALQKENNKELRRFLYEQLTAVAEKLGQEAPAMDQIGSDEPDEPPVVKQFWKVYSELAEQGFQVNHHRDPQRIGIHLKSFLSIANQMGYKFSSIEIKRQLKLSIAPEFISSNHGCRSKHLHKTTKVWLFDNNKAGLEV